LEIKGFWFGSISVGALVVRKYNKASQAAHEKRDKLQEYSTA
jgi:hypothetical protein